MVKCELKFRCNENCHTFSYVGFCAWRQSRMCAPPWWTL